MPTVVHNLEPWDQEIINRVVEELKPSVTDGTENFKYKENSDGTINISGLKAAADSNIRQPYYNQKFHKRHATRGKMQ